MIIEILTGSGGLCPICKMYWGGGGGDSVLVNKKEWGGGILSGGDFVLHSCNKRSFFIQVENEPWHP